MSKTYDNVPLEEPFDRTYKIEWLMDLPNSTTIRRYSFPPQLGNAGVILRVCPKSGDRFLAIVDRSVENLRIMTWPDPDAFLVTYTAWLINTTAPEKSEKLKGFDGHTVHYAYPFKSQNVVLIGHCCGIYCYSSSGLLWSHNDLFCCSDPIVDVTPSNELLLTAEKHGYDAGPSLKRLNLYTGQVLQR